MEEKHSLDVVERRILSVLTCSKKRHFTAFSRHFFLFYGRHFIVGENSP